MAIRGTPLEKVIRDEARAEGWHEAYAEILEHLQSKYLSDELKDPTSAEGIAILALAREVGSLLREKIDARRSS